MTGARLLGVSLILVFAVVGVLAIAEPQRWLFLFNRRGPGFLLLVLVLLGIFLLRESGKS
jgi:hypothetical protein